MKDSDNRIADIHTWKISSNHYAAIVSLVTHFPKPAEYYKELLSNFHKLSHISIEVHECKTELNNEKILFDDHIELGIMIEVPSAALLIKDFAEEVDFFSIGTNDLIQYMLAVDRGNDIVNNQYQEFHPSVIRTLHFIISEARKTNTKVTLCGEMAADFRAIPLLIGLGLDSISVSGAAIPYAKNIIRGLDYTQVNELASDCLKCKTEN